MFEHLISGVTNWSLCGIRKVSIWANGLHLNKQRSGDLTAVTTWPVSAPYHFRTLALIDLSCIGLRKYSQTAVLYHLIPQLSHAERTWLDVISGAQIFWNLWHLYEVWLRHERMPAAFWQNKNNQACYVLLANLLFRRECWGLCWHVPTFFVLFCSPNSHIMKVKRGPAAMKVGGRVSPDITSRCWLDSAEPEPWSRAWV